MPSNMGIMTHVKYLVKLRYSFCNSPWILHPDYTKYARDILRSLKYIIEEFIHYKLNTQEQGIFYQGIYWNVITEDIFANYNLAGTATPQSPSCIVVWPLSL